MIDAKTEHVGFAQRKLKGAFLLDAMNIRTTRSYFALVFFYCCKRCYRTSVVTQNKVISPPLLAKDLPIIKKNACLKNNRVTTSVSKLSLLN